MARRPPPRPLTCSSALVGRESMRVALEGMADWLGEPAGNEQDAFNLIGTLDSCVSSLEMLMPSKQEREAAVCVPR